MDDNSASTRYRNSFPAGPSSLGQIFDEDSSISAEQWKEEVVFQARDDDAEKEDRDREGLYAILNLPKTASESEIRDRYRQLAMLYHPDKQPTSNDPSSSSSSSAASRKLAAETHFNAIQNATSTLLDPSLRSVYDHFGPSGLESKWDVAAPPESKKRAGGVSTQEAEEFLLARAYDKRREKAENMVRSKADLNMSVDMRAVFLPKRFFDEKVRDKVNHGVVARLGRTRVGQLGLKSGFETSLSNRTQIVWAAQMLSRNGAGGGNVVGTVKHQFSPQLWIEAGSSLLAPRILTFKSTYAYDQDTFATVNAIQQTIRAPPSVSVTMGRKVWKGLTGFATVKSGFWELGPWGKGLRDTLGRHDHPALSLGLTTVNHTGSGFTMETSSSLSDRHASLDYSMRVLGGLKVKVGGSFGSSTGGNAFVECERQVTEVLKMGMGLTATYPGGLTGKIRLWRLGQKITIPILLSPNLRPSLILASLLIPTSLILSTHYLYVVPLKRRQVRDRVQELQQENADWVRQKKGEAEDAVALMEDWVGRRAEMERYNDGLIIVSAHYGLSKSFTPTGMRYADGEEDKVVDVTIPVQALVSSGKLDIPGGRPKFNLLGFYDPCIAEPKSLRIEYLFKGKLHSVTVSDMDRVRCPLRAHGVEDGRNGDWEL